MCGNVVVRSGMESSRYLLTRNTRNTRKALEPRTLHQTPTNCTSRETLQLLWCCLQKALEPRCTTPTNCTSTEREKRCSYCDVVFRKLWNYTRCTKHQQTAPPERERETLQTIFTKTWQIQYFWSRIMMMWRFTTQQANRYCCVALKPRCRIQWVIANVY